MKDLTGQVDNVTGLDADEWNAFLAEVQAIITAAGLGLSPADLDQVGKGIAAYVGASDFYQDVGTTNTYVLMKIGSRQAPPTLLTGLRVRFRPKAASTGASTIDVNGLGVKPLVREDGSPVVANDLVTTRDVAARYDASADSFFLQSTKGNIGQGNGAKVLLSTVDYPSSPFTRTVSWETEAYDDDEWFDAGSPTIFTIPSGITRVHVDIGLTRLLQGEGNHNYGVDLLKNGAPFAGAPSDRSVTRNQGYPNFYHSFGCSADLEVSPGDTLRVDFTGGGLAGGGARLLPRPESSVEANWFSIQAIG